uniref:Uncharacterized protein n=1 Tax=Chenopodium quinoa TaxID=63459 RepID=A0A803N1J0_CHEQI
MAQNTQQFGTRNDVKRVNDVELSGIKNQLQENAQQIATLTTLVSKIVPGNESTARSEDVNALNNFPSQSQRKYNPFSNTYNEVWRDHPNLRLPSQTLANPNEHAKAVTLRSGKELREPKIRNREVEKEVEVGPKDVVCESKEKHDKGSEKEPVGKGNSDVNFERSP